ncbi:unnamed protein product [Closterium sp. NIES-53]
MATPSVLTFDDEGRAVDLEVWVDDLQLFLQCDRADGLSLFDLTSGASPTPPATADSTVRSQWATRDAAARLAVRRHLPTTERAHFSQYRSAQTLYDAVVARYSSSATAALSRLILPYLFPDLAAFPTVADLITHLRNSDTRYRAALSAQFCAQNPPPMYITLYYIVTRLPDSLRLLRDHFLSVCPTTLTVDLLEQRLLAAETSIVARETPHRQGARGARALVGLAGAVEVVVVAVEGVGVVVGVVAGVEVSAAAVEAEEAVAVAEGAEVAEAAEAAVELVAALCRRVAPVAWYAGRQRGGGTGPCTYVLRTGDRAGEQCGGLHSTQRCFGRLTDAWRHQFPDATEIPRWGDLSRAGVAIFDLDYDAILAAMYAVSTSDEGDCYLCLPPDPGGEAAALGACEAAALGASASVAPGAGSACLLLRGGDSLTSASCPFRLDLERDSVWGPARVRGQGHERYFLLVVDDYSRYTTVFPLRSKGDVTEVLIDWIHAACLQLRESSSSDFPVLRLHSDRGGEFSSVRLGAFCRAQGIRQTFTLPASPQKNGIAERRIGMVMDVARTSMIHVAAPHFLWPFVVQYAAHQLNLQSRVSLPETSPTLRWTGKVGDASAFRVWGSRAFVRDLSADKLSPRAVPCVFLGFPPDAPRWQFYHLTSRRVLSSQDVTFDESVPYYRLFPYRTAPLPLPPLFLAPGPPLVDPLPLQGPALSGVSQVDAVEPVEVAVDSGAARGAEPVGAGSGGAESGGAEPWGAEPGGAEPRGAASGGDEPGGAEPGGAESARVASHSASSRRELLSPQELREWFAWRWSRAAGAGGPPVAPGPGGARICGIGAVGTGGAAAAAGVGAAGASGAVGAGATGGVGAGVGAAGAGAAGGVGAGVRPAGGTAGAASGTGAAGPAEVGAVGVGGAAGTGAAVGGPGAVPVGTGGPARPRPYFVPLLKQSPLQPVSPLPAPSSYAGPTGGLAERREPASRPASPVRTTRASRRAPRPRPPAVPVTHQMTLLPSTAPLRVPLPSPPESSLPVLTDPASDSLCAASPTVACLLSTVVTDPSFESTAASALVAELVDFAARCRLDYAASLVAESASVCPPSVGGECALSTDVLEDRQEEFQCFAAALPHLVSTLIALEGDPDAPDIPTPRSYAEAIEGPYSSQWQSAMDAEMASWKSTGTYVDDVPPPGANIVSGMWIFRVKRPPGSPPVFKALYVARGFSQRQGVDYFQTFSPTPKMTTLRVLPHVAAQRDYKLHSLDFSTAFLQGSLHEEILRRPVYGLRQAPREWHDTLRTTLAALGFAPSTADPSLFLRTDTSLPPFYILVYVDDLVFATPDTAGLAHVKAQRTITLTQSHMVQQVLQRFDFTYCLPQATPLSTRHSLSALPSDESVEPSGPYPELVGCLMYLMTCTRPDLAYPLSILARYVAPGRHRPEHMAAAKRVLRYLCSTSGLGLVLGGRSPVVLTVHADASWADDQATQRSSQGYTFSLGSGSVSWRSNRSSSELRWLTYLLTDLGEPPRSPPVLYVDNKAMLALCREHRLEHRTKHIALRYILARELQQRGQLRLAYVASEANTADIFTKALPPGDHQRFCTMLACFALLDWSCDLLFSPTLPMGTVRRLRRDPPHVRRCDERSHQQPRVLHPCPWSWGTGDRGTHGECFDVVAEVGASVAAVEVEAAVAVAVGQQQRSRETPSPQQLREWYAGRQGSGGAGPCAYVLRTDDHTGEQCGGLHATQRCFGRLTDAWRTLFPDATKIPRWGDLLRSGVAIFDLDFDAILAAMYAVSISAEGDCYVCVSPDPSIEAAALGASEFAVPGAGESALSGTVSAQVLHTFTLDSGASRSFFRDRTTLTPLSRPVAVSLTDPSGDPVLAHYSTVLPCPAAPSGSLSGLYLPLFSTNLVAASSQVFTAVSRSGPASAPCSCRLLSHQTLLWHHRLGHPSLPRLRGMASRLLVSGLPQSLPPLPPGPAPTCVPCVEGRQRAAPHSSEFPPTEAPLQTLHMDVWGPARVRGQGHERYFLLVIDDYSRYTTVFPLRSKGEVTEVGGEFSSDLLRAFCRAEGIRQTFALPASPQKNRIDERRIGMVMDVARTSMIHAAAPHFLWPFAVQYAAHQIKIQPRVSMPETSPTLWWTGKVGDASAFRVWGSRAFFRDLSANKLSSRAVPWVFFGFPPDASGWQFYHPTSRRVLSSQDVTFDESVPYYRLFPYRTAPLPPPPLFLTPVPPPVDPLPPQGPAPSAYEEPGGAGSGGAELERAELGGAGSGVAGPERAELGGSEPGVAESWSAEPAGAGPGGPSGAFRAAGAGGTSGSASAGGAGAMSPGCARTGGTGAAGRGGVNGAGATRGFGAGGAVGVGATGGTGAGAADSFDGPTGAGAAGGTGAGGAAGASASVGAGAGATGAAGGATSAGGAAGVGADAGGAGAVPAGSGGAAAASESQLQLASPLPAPSPYAGPTGGLAERREPKSRPASPVRTAHTSRQRPPAVPGTHQMALCPSTASQRVRLPSPTESSLPALADPASESLRATSPTVTRFLATAVTDPSFEFATAFALVSELVDFAAHCRLDYAASLVAESASMCPPSVGGECALTTDVLEDRQEEF